MMARELDLNDYKMRVADNSQEVTLFLLTYNREKYVQLMIDSILRQTYGNFSLIVLDNCSTDNTRDVVLGYNDDRIFYQKRVSNFANSDTNMRYAFEICETDYLIVLHDDDILEIEFLKIAVNTIKNGNYVAVSSGAKIIDQNGDLTGELFSMPEKKAFSGDEYFKYYYSQNTQTLVYPSVIYKKEFYNDYKRFITVMDAGPCNDQYLWFQIGRYGGEILLDNSNTYLYRIHSNQDSYLKAGYMDYELLDFLFTQEYYIDVINSDRKRIIKRILGRFMIISREYYESHILSKEKYKSVFDYHCVKWLKTTTYGIIGYFFMRLIGSSIWIGKLGLMLDSYRKRHSA